MHRNRQYIRLNQRTKHSNKCVIHHTVFFFVLPPGGEQKVFCGKETDLIRRTGPPAVLPPGYGPVMTVTVALLRGGRTPVAPFVTSFGTCAPVVLTGSMGSFTTVKQKTYVPFRSTSQEIAETNTLFLIKKNA